MENGAEGKMLIAKFFESALKEKFYQLSGRYDAEKIFESLTRILEREEVKNYFRRAWAGDLAIDDALDQLEDYMGISECSLTAAEGPA
jgi:hypothetical protein